MEQAQKILEQVFGYHAFRSHQGDLIKTVIEGGDALALMPTGGGKSLCYQIPALIRDGVGIVVSPLIALMQDQVDALTQLGVKAAFLNSSQDMAEQRRVEDLLLNKELDLLYIAPERLLLPRMLNLLSSADLALFAIDEAHCVSQWGHDFRPEYRQLSQLADYFEHVPRIALTATADPRTRAEIVEQLRLKTARQYVASFDRPNIRYIISEGGNARNRLWDFLQEHHKSDAGIIYCLSRKKVEDVAAWLREKGRNALPYHAGLSDSARQQNQARFLREEGIIIVATIAFGMGIDKPDVRFVGHLNLPKSIEAYYQETGRAGRDGEPANAWLAYSMGDAITYRQWIDQSDAGEEQKRVERQKLEALLGLCALTSCRRQVLLSYFGEEESAACGNCDNCLSPPETFDGREYAQKALSAVYRTGQRFGVQYVIKVLRGGKEARILQNGHDKLSTFGIGKDKNENFWRGVFRQLVTMGYLRSDPENYGGLSMTDICRPLLKGEIEFLLRKEMAKADPIAGEKKAKRGGKGGDDIGIADQPLWEALRALRLRLAGEQRVPPYVVCHDKTLKELVHIRPGAIADLHQITGLGDAKIKRYGEKFLAEIKAHPRQELLDNKLSESTNKTLALYLEGIEIGEIAKKRMITEQEVHEHFAEAIEAGLLQAKDVLDLDGAEMDEITGAFERLEILESGQLTPAFEALDGRYDYGVLKCVMAAQG